MHLENISLIMLAESGAILNAHGKMGIGPEAICSLQHHSEPQQTAVF
jgi:hypothetical protein